MRCNCLRYFALSLAALATLVSASAAADDQPGAAILPEAIKVNQSPDVGVKPSATLPDAAAAAPAPSKPKSGVPTRAKRKTAVAALAVETAPKAESANAPASKPEPAAGQAKGKTADELLRPIPDAMEGGPVTIEAASFKGVTPGLSTKANVEKAWGKPKETAQPNGSLVQLYSVDPFRRVEVNYDGDRVASVVIRFDRPFPADGVAKQLDLATVRPVLISNELGEVLGLAYPERGVLFAFEASKETEKPSMKVAQLVLEPISAEPFVLRAETTLESRRDLSRRDLEQALSLEPDNARAHWLNSRVLVGMEQYEKALAEAGHAVRLSPDNPHYHVTRSQVLAQLGRLPEAVEEAQKAVDNSQKRPHVKARALCLMGDLTASGAKPDYKKALELHTQALQIADPLTSDPHPALRVAAKEALIDAHLGAAHDIAWGEWKEKSKAVVRWLERALAVANDLVATEGASEEQVFRVYVRAMAAYVGVHGGIDLEPTVTAVVATGNELIAGTGDPIRRAQFQWDLGMALYDAVQICQMRAEYDSALKYGQQSADYLTKANETKRTTSSAFLLGRLYFRLGTIHAMGNHDHRAAVAWFDKAVPLLERPSLEDLATDLGRHGETFVSMGVSYWEAGQKEKAVTLTEKGIKWMEQAVAQGTLDRPALAVPYNNLASMHRKLGSGDKADKFQELAGKAKTEKLK
jgi:tetratricopeptide (TPR) repeat protein